jgi:hypothetical protein
MDGFFNSLTSPDIPLCQLSCTSRTAR